MFSSFISPIESIILQHFSFIELLTMVRQNNFFEVKSEAGAGPGSEVKKPNEELALIHPVKVPFAADPDAFKKAVLNHLMPEIRDRLALFQLLLKSPIHQEYIQDFSQNVKKNPIMFYYQMHYDSSLIHDFTQLVTNCKVPENEQILSELSNKQLELLIRIVTEWAPLKVPTILMTAYIILNRIMERRSTAQTQISQFYVRLIQLCLKSLDFLPTEAFDVAINRIESEFIDFILCTAKRLPELCKEFFESRIAKEMFCRRCLIFSTIVSRIARENDANLLTQVLECASDAWKANETDQLVFLNEFFKHRLFNLITVCVRYGFCIDLPILDERQSSRLDQHVVSNYFKNDEIKSLFAVMLKQIQNKSVRFMNSGFYDLKVRTFLEATLNLMKKMSIETLQFFIGEHPELFTIDTLPPKDQIALRHYGKTLGTYCIEQNEFDFVITLMTEDAPFSRSDVNDFIKYFENRVSFYVWDRKMLSEGKELLTIINFLKLLNSKKLKVENNHPVLQILFVLMRHNHSHELIVCINSFPQLLTITNEYQLLPWQAALKDRGGLSYAETCLNKMLEHKIPVNPEQGALEMEYLLVGRRGQLTKQHLEIIRLLIQLNSDLPHGKQLLPIGRGFDNALFSVKDPLFSALITVLRQHPKGNQWIADQMSNSDTRLDLLIKNNRVEELLSLIVSGVAFNHPLPHSDNFQFKTLMVAAFEVCHARKEFKTILQGVKQAPDDKTPIMIAQIERLFDVNKEKLSTEEWKIIDEMQANLSSKSIDQIRQVVQDAILKLLNQLQQNATHISNKFGVLFSKNQPKLLGLQKLIFLQQYLYLGSPTLEKEPAKAAAASCG